MMQMRESFVEALSTAVHGVGSPPQSASIDSIAMGRRKDLLSLVTSEEYVT